MTTLTSKSIRNRYAHLTNYSVNKKSENFVKNGDATLERGPWALTAYWKYMEEKLGVDVPALRKKIFDIAVKTLIAAEPNIASKVNQAGRPSCFELFGLDVLLDSEAEALADRGERRMLARVVVAPRPADQALYDDRSAPPRGHRAV